MYVGKPSYELDVAEYTAGVVKGYVFKTQEELSEDTCVGFYIPKILPLVDATSGPVETDESIESSIFANNVSVPSTVKTTNYIKAKYNGRSNFSQPIIALGETAHIFFFNHDYKLPRYTDAYNDERRRKTDILRMYVHSKDDSDNEKDPYYIELNSVDGFVKIHTGTDNGESHSYDQIIDTKNSKVIIQDDDGNSITMSTEDKQIVAENSSGSSIDIVDKDINIKCDGDVTIDCDNMKVTTKSGTSIDAKTKIEMKTPKMTLNADTMLEITTAMCKASVSSMTQYQTPTFLVSGLIAAPTVGMSPAPMSPPAVQLSNASGATLTPSPRGIGAFGDKTMTTIMAMIPFLKISPVAAGVVSPLASQIIQPQVKL